MKILFISNVPSPYNIEYLNELGKLAEVMAVFERSESSERDDSWKKLNIKNFKCVILKGMKWTVDSAISFKVKKYIREFRNEKIIIGNPSTPTGIIAILYCKSHRIPYILQSEGGFQGSGKGLKEKFKYYLMKDARLYLSGMNIENEYFLKYGATPERVIHYPFTSFYAEDLRKEMISEEEKMAFRRELNMMEDTIFISVGQFIHRKGFDVLLRAYQGMPQDVGLYIIGGTPTKEYLNLVEKLQLKNVHFLEFKDKETLKKYYLASDIFVLATREDTWGLVINEAMSLCLPIITTNRCIAGLTLIKEGENGYIVPIEDIDALRDRMMYLAAHKDLQIKMAKNNLQKIQRYTFEEMASTIYTALTFDLRELEN